MDGSDAALRLQPDVAPLDGPPIIRYLHSKGRLEAQAATVLKGRSSMEVMAKLRAAPATLSQLVPGVEAIRINSAEVLTVDTPQQRMVLDLRMGRTLALHTATGDEVSDARARCEAELCAAHLVDYYKRADQTTERESAAAQRAVINAATNRNDLLARSLARFEKTQRIDLDEDPSFRI